MYGSALYGSHVYGDAKKKRGILGGTGVGMGVAKVTPYQGLRSITPSTGPTRPYPSPPRYIPRPSPTIRAVAEASLGGIRINPREFSNEWLAGFHGAPRFVLRLLDTYVYTAWPVPAAADELMYVKNQVQVTGTQSSPETFTTNVGKLVTMQTGAPFPTFDDTTHAFHVAVNSAKYQEASISVVKGSISEVGGALTFQLYYGYNGNAATDGNYYCDIAIFLQTI